MKSLAKGQSSEAIFRLIKVLINAQQQDFERAVAGDTTAIEDIADKLESKMNMYESYEKSTANAFMGDQMSPED